MGLFLYDLVAQPVPAGATALGRSGRGLTMSELHRGDSEIALMPARPEIKDLHSRTERSVRRFRDKQFVGYIWLALAGYDEDEVRCTIHSISPRFDCVRLRPRTYFQNIAWVEHHDIWNGANEFLRNRGVRYSCSRITRFNVASRNAHARLGAQPYRQRIVSAGVVIRVDARDGKAHMSTCPLARKIVFACAWTRHGLMVKAPDQRQPKRWLPPAPDGSGTPADSR